MDGADDRARPVTFDAASGTLLLSTPATSYVLRLTDRGVRHLHWGRRLELAAAASLPLPPEGGGDDVGDELPGDGGARFGPAGLRVAFADGTEVVEWRVDGHAVDGGATGGGGHVGHLVVRLADRHYPLLLELHYRVWSDSDVLERWSVLRHTGTGDPVTVARCDSASWTLPHRDGYRMSTVVGDWASEFQVRRVPVPPGETVTTARRGSTRHQQNPWLMVDTGSATEEHGEVWSVVLAWSGTWQLGTWRTPGDRVVVGAGAGHDAARRSLRPGEAWTQPVCAGLYSAGGFGATSRQWHRYVRGHVLPDGDALPPVLYNSWEGTWFDVNVDGQRRVAAAAAELGVELFVMDDGWFGRRLSDDAGLGDWWPNPDRFPGGLTPLIDEVHRLGMRFGIWVEPEMVNPDSDLYRQHPEWVLHMPNRHRTEQRNQLVLNFARADVAAWAHGWLDDLLERHAIDFMKWDMNRAFTEAGWPGHGDPHRLFFDHTAAVYSIIDRLRADHPGLRIEACASGGGRADLGVLRRTDQVWTSDNTDPVDRIAIQHGYGQVYPALTMGAWASESPNPVNRRATPLRFRFHVAMAGALGISGDLSAWPEADRREATELVAAYRQIRPVVARGQLYRLTPPAVDRVTAVQYVTDDAAETVVLAWRAMARHGQPQPPVRLGGLDPAARYRCRQTGAEHHASVLAGRGLVLDLPDGDFASTLVHLRRV